jgi:hypothetical protein
MRLHFLFFLPALLILSSCAKIIAPDGGDKDTTSPVILHMVPENETTSFAGSEFYIEFDEYIQLKDIYNQLIVSPPLSEKPEIRIKRKALYVKIKEPLKPNTTYTFNFGEGVVDLNESNPVNELIYVLATGAELDTLGFGGQVVDAFTAQPVEAVKVMVYSTFEDSIPMKEKPYYFGRTAKDGRFKVSNMKSGIYKVVAVEEINNNYLYDAPATERIAFLDSIVRPSSMDSNRVEVFFRLSAETPQIQYIQDYRIDSTGFATLKFFTKPDSLSFVALDQPENHLKFERELHTDSIFLWWSSESLNQPIMVEVRKREEVLDTIKLSSYNARLQTLQLRSAKSKKVSVQNELILRWNRPVVQIDSAKWSLTEDSIPLGIEIIRSTSDFETELVTKFTGGKKYNLEVLPGGVTSREGWKNDTLKYDFQVYEDKHFGTINLQLNLAAPEGQWIVRMIDLKGKVIRQQVVLPNQKLRFERVLPDQYTLQLLDDKNMNTEWDAVDYLNHIQPERIVPFSEGLNVRSNWEMDLNWEIK